MIYFYTVGDERVASSRMRVWHVARALGLPHRVTVVRPYRSAWEWRPRRIVDFGVLLVRACRHPRARFYVHKVISPPELILLFYLIRSRVIFDLDDEVRGRWATLIMKHASRVVVSSHGLAEDVHTYHDRVTLIPTSIPLHYYQPKESPNGHVPVIGWIGTGKGQVENLKILIPVLQRLRASGISFTCRIVGAQRVPEIHTLFDEWGEVVDDIDWSKEEIVAAMVQSFDIGVMPLVDGERNRRKAGFKLIQYMACGVPAVASTVGENVFIIEDGVSGYLAKDEDEWFLKLSALLSDEHLRARLGRQSLGAMRERYALDSMIPLYSKIL